MLPIRPGLQDSRRNGTSCGIFGASVRTANKCRACATLTHVRNGMMSENSNCREGSREHLQAEWLPAMAVGLFGLYAAALGRDAVGSGIVDF